MASKIWFAPFTNMVSLKQIFFGHIQAPFHRVRLHLIPTILYPKRKTHIWEELGLNLVVVDRSNQSALWVAWVNNWKELTFLRMKWRFTFSGTSVSVASAFAGTCFSGTEPSLVRAEAEFFTGQSDRIRTFPASRRTFIFALRKLGSGGKSRPRHHPGWTWHWTWSGGAFTWSSFSLYLKRIIVL